MRKKASGALRPSQENPSDIPMSFSSEGVRRFFEIALRSPGVNVGRVSENKLCADPFPKSKATLDTFVRKSFSAWMTTLAADVCFAETVKRGVPLKAIDALINCKILTMGEVTEHVLPRRTFDHRKRKKEPLTPQESERALRIIRIVAIAEDTFANAGKAATWLRRPNRTMDGRAPLDMADTEPGGRIVEDALNRIAHGIAA